MVSTRKKKKVVRDWADQVGEMEVPPCIRIGYIAYLPRKDLHLCNNVGYSSAMFEDRVRFNVLI